MPNGRKPGEKPEPAKPTGRREAKGGKPRMTLEERAERRAARKAERGPGWMPEPDGKVHVPTIGTADPEILPKRLKIALEHYYTLDRSSKDKAIITAAQLADMDPAELRKYMAQPAVREIVQRRLDRIDFCKAAYIAKSQVLELHYVDTKLAEAVHVAAKSGDSKPMELAYERLGVRRDKNFMTTEQASPQSRPQIYRVLEQTVTRTEQMTQREITTSSPNHGLLPSARNSDSEILEY